MSKFGVTDSTDILISKAYKGLLTSTIASTKKQKDIYLNETPLLLNFCNDIWTEIELPIYKEGLFNLNNEKLKSEIVINLNHKFVSNTRCHLPFYLKMVVGTNQVFMNTYGHFNETNVCATIIADVSLLLPPRFFIRKIFNDPGLIEIQPNSFISINTF